MHGQRYLRLIPNEILASYVALRFGRRHLSGGHETAGGSLLQETKRSLTLSQDRIGDLNVATGAQPIEVGRRDARLDHKACATQLRATRIALVTGGRYPPRDTPVKIQIPMQVCADRSIPIGAATPRGRYVGACAEVLTILRQRTVHRQSARALRLIKIGRGGLERRLGRFNRRRVADGAFDQIVQRRIFERVPPVAGDVGHDILWKAEIGGRP
jgi:hypothetical protein